MKLYSPPHLNSVCGHTRHTNALCLNSAHPYVMIRIHEQIKSANESDIQICKLSILHLFACIVISPLTSKSNMFHWGSNRFTEGWLVCSAKVQPWGMKNVWEQHDFSQIYLAFEVLCSVVGHWNVKCGLNLYGWLLKQKPIFCGTNWLILGNTYSFYCLVWCWLCNFVTVSGPAAPPITTP